MQQDYTHIRIRSGENSEKFIALSVPMQEFLILKKLAEFDCKPYSDFIKYLLECKLFKNEHNITYRLTRLAGKDLIKKEWYIDEEHPKSHRRTMLTLSSIVDRNSLGIQR